MLTEAASSIPAYKLWGALLGGGVEYLHMKSKHNTFFLSFLSWEGDSFFKSLFFFFWHTKEKLKRVWTKADMVKSRNRGGHKSAVVQLS